MKIRESIVGVTAIYSVSNILNGAIPFFLLPLFTRLLSPQQYGELAMFTVVLGILSAFTGLSVQGAVNSRYVDRAEIDFPSYVGSCFWVLAFSTAVTVVVVGAFRKEISHLANISPLWLFVAISVSFFTFITQIRLGIWQMELQPVKYGSLQISMTILNAVLSVVLVLWIMPNAEGRLWGQTAATVIFGLVSFLSLRRAGWINMRLNATYIKEIFEFGIPLIPHVIGGFLLTSVDRLVVNERLGLHAAGVYMVAAQLGVGLAMVADAFNKAFVPWLYGKLKAESDRSKQIVVKVTWLYFLAALTFAGCIGLSAPYIISWCAGAAYHQSASAFAWIALAQAFGGMYLMVTNYVFYRRKTALLGWFTLLSGTIGVLASWFLIPSMGLAGAGAGLALGAAVKFLLTWRLAQFVCPMPWFGWKKNLSVGEPALGE